MIKISEGIKHITSKKLMSDTNMNSYRLQEIKRMAQGLFGFECYYFQIVDGKLYAGGVDDIRTVKKGYRADYCINQGIFYEL